MATVLSYATPERPTLRRYVGPIATGVALCGSALVVAATFQARYALEAYVGGGRCGTPQAKLEMQLYVLPALLFVPSAAAAAVADQLHHCVATSRVSICVAILGWAACAFVG